MRQFRTFFKDKFGMKKTASEAAQVGNEGQKATQSTAIEDSTDEAVDDVEQANLKKEKQDELKPGSNL